MPEINRVCDIIIPVWNQPEVTKDCLDSIVGNTDYPYRIILIDNGSEPETAGFLRDFTERHKDRTMLIVNKRNEGFIKAVNMGLEASSSAYVCMMNNDTMPARGWLSRLVSFAESHDDVGLLNPLCGGHLAAGTDLNGYADAVASNAGKYMEMNQCQGFSMLVKRTVIDTIGHLDERFGIGGFDDTDYSMRAHKAGYRSVCVHSAYVYHREHKSFDALGERKSLQAAGEREYFRKWPRHLRAVIISEITDKTPDTHIANLLGTALYMAREWCWINLWIFGRPDSVKNRIDTVRERIGMPEHQNIKYGFRDRRLLYAESVLRLAERSFGSKRRKKYDIMISDRARLIPVLRVLAKAQGAGVVSTDFAAERDGMLDEAMGLMRGTRADERDRKRCDIILPVCNQYECTQKCIESIIRHTDTPYRLIVVNNGDCPKTKELLGSLERNPSLDITVIDCGGNVGWVRAVNRALEMSDAPYVCLQNNDTIVTAGWLRKLIGILDLKENYGLVNPVWDGRPKNISVDAYNSMLEKRRGQGKAFIETDWCRGFSVVIKRAVIEAIGKLDEIYGLAYFDDVDYSVAAIEAGFLCLKALDTYIEHYRNVTANEVLKGDMWSELHEKNKRIYYAKWGRPLRALLILDAGSIDGVAGRDRISNMVYYLARKQHKVEILSSDSSLISAVKHTNVRMRACPGFALAPASVFLIRMNLRKRAEKRFDAVFVNDVGLYVRLSRMFGQRARIFTEARGLFDIFVKQTMNDLKAGTRNKPGETVDAEV
ncbi:MAG: glycosyltransferase family 2 protein [Candidatus Omnitrophota bacterium]